MKHPLSPCFRRRLWAANLLVLLIFALLAVLFFLSAQPAEESYALTNTVQAELEQAGLSSLTPKLGEYTVYQSIRKWGHIYLFALLGACAAGVRLLTRREYRPLVGEWRLPLLSCLLAACGDEFHQRFVPGREGTLRDVGFDLLGICAGITLVLLFALFLRRKLTPPPADS